MFTEKREEKFGLKSSGKFTKKSMASMLVIILMDVLLLGLILVAIK